MPLPTCTAVGCNIQTPVINNPTCAPTGLDGEVTALYITDTAITNVTQLATIDNSELGGLKKLLVTGSINAPEQATQEVEGGVTLRTRRKTRSVSCQAFNVSDVNYEAMRAFECGKPCIVYIELGGEKVLGGEANFIDGISTVLNANLVTDGAGSFARFDIDFSWKAQYAPAIEDAP